MAIVLFVILSVGELALLGWSLATKSTQQKARGAIRLLVLALFVLLVALDVIPWSFRWAALAALLLLLAARALWILLYPAPRQPRFSARRAVLRSMALALLLFLAIAPALVFPPYELPQTTGPYSVGTARHSFSDAVRRESYGAAGEMRQVNVAFWYPEDAQATEQFALVLFSHGGLGLDTGNEFLYRELASHGYVVASIGHPYHAFWTRSEDGRLTFVNMDYMRDLQQEDAGRDRAQSYAYYQAWMATRTGDINLALDSILQRAGDGSAGVYELVDGERIGVMGHSLGGAAALAMPRQRDDVSAVIALESPFLYEITGVVDGQFVWRQEPYPAPALNVYSDGAWNHLGEWPQYARNAAFLTAAPPHVSSMHLPGAGHFSLTDLALASPLLVRLLEGAPPRQESVSYLQELNKVCLAFFNQHLE